MNINNTGPVLHVTKKPKYTDITITINLQCLSTSYAKLTGQNLKEQMKNVQQNTGK